MIRKLLAAWFSALALTSAVQAQNAKYLILLKDKTASPYSISRPGQFLSARAIQRRAKQGIGVTERDLPVNPAYVDAIRATGATVWFTSRWANAVLVETTAATLATIQNLPFVQGIEANRSLSAARVSSSAAVTNQRRTKLEAVTDSIAYGNSGNQLVQIGVDKMHTQGYHGEGMLIAILDAGFRNATTVPFLRSLFTERRVVGTYDFVRNEPHVYEDDAHGLNVLSIMAGYQENELVGPAYKASYLLLRTEDAATESPLEEANWLFGVEYADSAGVDVINSSLGYTEFDDPTQNHTYSQLDGKTTLITRAANWAAEAGMVVVVSAGNDGAGGWRYIGAPADAAPILTIGAVDKDGFRALFSSFGPTADGRIKPDLVAQGQATVVGSPSGSIGIGSGTSFSSPLVAALAAGFWQAHPRLTAPQVIESLRRSGSQYNQPDNELGYGIPNFERASAVVAEDFKLVVYPNPFTIADGVVVQWNEIPLNQLVDATLTNAVGQVVWRQRYSSNEAIRLSFQALNQTAGVYFLTLSTSSARRIVKLLKY